MKCQLNGLRGWRAVKVGANPKSSMKGPIGMRYVGGQLPSC
jgi:hypothetical protein